MRYTLVRPDVRQRAIQAVSEAPDGFVVTIKEPARNLDQNALLHVLLTEVAEAHEWAGRKRDIETWKRLMVAAWDRARGAAIEYLPALDGHGVDIVFRRTSQLSKAECCELIEFINAWMAEQEVVS